MIRVPGGRSIFGTGRERPNNPEANAKGIVTASVPLGTFRRTMREREALPPREVVTGRLLGDPGPGRIVPEIPPDLGSGVVRPLSPIYLTFREYRAALGETG